MSAPRDVWDERPVIFGEINMEEGDVVVEAFAVNRFKGSRLLLSLTLRWADTNELVFASAADISALPFRMFDTISRLSAKAAFVNGLRRDDPDEPPTVATTNGHDAGAAPSL